MNTTEQAQQIVRSWELNAEPWAQAVRDGAIASRRLATDAAVLQAILGRRPARVLDAGCGEGWLVRALAAGGVQATGIDASAPLIEQARAAGGDFQVCSYAELVEQPEHVGTGYDAIVFNFALFEEQLGPLLRAIRTRLSAQGVVLIQTLHPWSAAGQGPYQDGWRVETFAGFEGFVEPMPWYFRTLASWVALLRDSGYCVEQLREPAHPETHAPLSLLLIAAPVA